MIARGKGRQRSIAGFVAMVAALVVMAGAGDALAKRGRVHVSDGKLLTDKCTLLRGIATISSDPNYWVGKSDYQNARDQYGLNSVHAYVGNNLSLEKDRLDQLVQWTAELDMYLIITACCWVTTTASTVHCFYERTPTDRWNQAKAFWDWAAPRYKDETHGIYEWQNESNGYPTDISSADAQNQVNGYNLMRSHAPNTHLMMWCMNGNLNIERADRILELVRGTQGINYSNASLGFHPGGVPTPGLDQNFTNDNSQWTRVMTALMDEGYAITATETNVCADPGYSVQWWCEEGFRTFKNLDEMGIGWQDFHFMFNLNSTWKQKMGEFGPQWHPDFGSWPLSTAPSCQPTAPAAVIRATPTAGYKPLVVALNGSNSTGDISSYAWSYSGGGSATGASVSRTFTTAGTHTVTLTVSGGAGSDTAMTTVTVWDSAALQGCVQIPATSYATMSGIEKKGDTAIGYVDGGDWVQYSNVDLGTGVGTTMLTVRVAVPTDFANQTVEFRLDNATGPLIATLRPQATGSAWGVFGEQSVAVSGATGVHDLVVKFIATRTDSMGVGDFGWFRFCGPTDGTTRYAPRSAAVSAAPGVVRVYSLTGQRVDRHSGASSVRLEQRAGAARVARVLTVTPAEQSVRQRSSEQR